MQMNEEYFPNIEENQKGNEQNDGWPKILAWRKL